MEKDTTRFLRAKQVAKMLGIGKSTVWLMSREGRLPSPIKLSPRITVWKAEDIELWIQNQ